MFRLAMLLVLPGAVLLSCSTRLTQTQADGLLLVQEHVRGEYSASGSANLTLRGYYCIIERILEAASKDDSDENGLDCPEEGTQSSDGNGENDD